MWGITGLHLNKTPHNTSDSMVHKIKEVMGSLNRNTVARACRCFQSWSEAVVEADSNFISENCSQYIILPIFYFNRIRYFQLRCIIFCVHVKFSKNSQA